MAMQNIVNNTPFKSGKVITKDNETGKNIFILAVKATYEFNHHGDLKIAEEQEDLFDTAIFFGEERYSSVQYPPDLWIQKPLVDLIVNGSAYAPNSEPIQKVVASISLGTWEKEIQIIGDRYWISEFGFLKRTEPDPFLKKDIIYENAFGGYDQSEDAPPVEERQYHLKNPVGTGFAVKRKYLEGLKLPNIEVVGKKTGKNARGNEVEGLGAIDLTWFPRVGYSGTYDENWQKNRYPRYPDDFDPGYYQWAPEDQQFENISPGESIRLIHLTQTGEIRLKLPSVDLKIDTTLNSSSIDMVPKLQTLLIEPEKNHLIFTWTAQLTDFNPESKLESIIDMNA